MTYQDKQTDGTSKPFEPPVEEKPKQAGSPWVKGVGLLFLLLLAWQLYFWFGGQLSLQILAERETQLRALQEARPGLVMLVAFALYVLVTGLSLPGATAMTLVVSWYLGFWRSLLLISFASTTGATVAFLLSRYLLRDWMSSRFGDRLDGFNRNLERDGAFYLFTLRLIPVVPFFIINVVMGLTPIKTWTFWWVSQVGMFAGTCVYVYAGASVPSLKVLADRGISGIISPQLLVAFALLGLFPLIVRRTLTWATGKESAGEN